MELAQTKQNVPVLHDEWLYYLSPRFLTYRPKIKIFYQTEKYTLKTAEHMSELVELFRLRHFVFLSDGSSEDILDVDQFDSECDHIIIKCNSTNEICGTYRVITNNNHVGFYSETEFNLDQFVGVDGVKMELGRACIHPYHRNGAVIDLLWRGIGQYANKINAQYLFGCSSTNIMSKCKVNAIINFLTSNNNYSSEYNVSTKDKFSYDLNSAEVCEIFSESELKKSLPPLLLSYINAGAKVYGVPALDVDFDCLDFFTILNLKDLSSSYKKRYFKMNEEN